METIKIEEMEIEFWKQHPNSSCKCVVKITNTQTDDSVTLRDTQALQLASAINEAFGEWLDVDDNTPTDEYLFALIGGKVYIKYIDSANKMWYNYTDDYTYTTNTKWQPITKPRP